MAKKKTAPSTVDLVVRSDTHTHAGKPVKRGDTIKVTPAVKELMEKLWDVTPRA